MDKVTDVISQNRCSGCAACMNVCPVGAIEMVANNEGFLFPQINMEKCIDCGLCAKKCPVENPVYLNNPEPDCLAVAAKDELRLKSASGGIYSAFADYMLKRGGYICGAAYTDDNSWNVMHIVGNTIETLEKTRNSKYVQSNAGMIYQEVKELLEQEKEVLFSGTPCQVAGLNAFLGKTYKNLFTMDIVCHGVPSPKVFHKYLEEYYGEKNIVNIDFRAKDYYGWSSTITVKMKNGDVYRSTNEKDPFYRAFLPCMSLRKSCESCPFSHIPRQGDLTIGDFWGINSYDASLNDKKGISVVLVNNDKGKQMLSLMSEYLIINEKVPIEYALRVNKTIERPFHAHYGRKHLFSSLDLKPLKEIVPNAASNHYDVGIIGPWYGLNYGSILTYFALYEVIKQHGMDPFLLAKPYKLWNDEYANRNSIAGRFIYPRCNVMNYRKHDYDWILMNQHCDIFIVGSDVVWNYNVFGRDAGSFFFLDFVKDSKKKIAYAASFGAGYEVPEEDHARNKYYMKKFDAVSVRENDAVEICKNKFGISADIVIDPVFLCDKEKYYRIADEITEEKQKYMMAYILGVDIAKKNILVAISKQLGCGIRYFANPNIGGKKKAEGIMQLPMAENETVEYWLHSMKECSYYVGDSFHGLCFALIFHREFICIVGRNIQGLTRFQTLLEICGLEDRLVFSDDPYEKIEKLLQEKINYAFVDERLHEYINKSNAWLHEALFTPKELSYGDSDRIIELEEEVNKLTKLMEEMTKK